MKGWSSGKEAFPNGKLDILINNAAPTLTDPIEAEKEAILSEAKLRMLLGSASPVIENGYEATVGGGSQMLGGLIEASELAERETEQPYTSFISQNVKRGTATTVASGQEIAEAERGFTATPSNSPWLQTLKEIPYEDIISAHSVNAFVSFNSNP